MREPTGKRPDVVRRCAVVAFVVVNIGVAATRVASAQVPAVPDVPAPVQDVLAQVQETASPVLVQVAVAAQPVMTAGGFALRPACGAPVTSVLFVLALGSVPLNPGFVSTPLNLLCAGAFGVGPADPAFAAVDEAAGAQLEAAAQPAIDEVAAGVAPARPNLGEVCTALKLAAPPAYFAPPPLDRFDVTSEVCGR